MSLAICIVNWNTRDLLIDGVRHLFEEDPSRSVWVLDNGSTDGSAARLAEVYPQVHLVESSENRGFAAGVRSETSRFVNFTIRERGTRPRMLRIQ